MIWYKHFLDDYDRDTQDLSLLQHGAYRRLLDAYFQREGPLPQKLSQIYRMVRAHSGAEQRAVSSILSRFFNLHDGLYFNNRAQSEIVKYQAQCAANRRSNRGAISTRIGTEVRSKKEKNGFDLDLNHPTGTVQGLILRPENITPDVERNKAIAALVASTDSPAAARAAIEKARGRK